MLVVVVVLVAGDDRRGDEAVVSDGIRARDLWLRAVLVVAAWTAVVL